MALSPKSPIQQQEPILTSTNLINYLAENQSEKTESEQETEDSENKEEMASTYIAKIPDFSGEDIETSPQEWLDQVTKVGDANGWNAVRMLRTISYFLKGTAEEWFENLATPFNDWNAFKTAFLEQFTYNNTSITLQNQFRNIKQKFSKSDKLIKKVCSHAPKDLNSAIQHAKKYKMAMEDANCTKLLRKKLTNSQRRLKTISPTNNNSNSKDINHPKNEIKITLHHFLITSLRITITVESLATGKEIAESYNETNKIGIINQSYYQPPPLAYYLSRLQYQTNPTAIPTTTHTTLSSACSKIDSTKLVHITKLIPTQPRPNYYHILPSYLMIPEEQDFCHTAFPEGRAAAQQQNSSYTSTTISPARIAENANLSDIFPFKFEANKSPFLLSNAVANEQKVITAMYIEAEVKEKPICLILDTQTIIVTADGMKKTPVGEIDNFPFTINGITIPVKVLTQELTIFYQGQHVWIPAICGTFNKHSKKAPAFKFKPEEEKPIIETFMALGSTSNWANETEQQYFSTNDSLKTKELVTTRWNVPYLKPEPRKQRPYIPLKYKDCHKKLSSMEAYISPEEEYENHTCYYCKACHREQWGHLIKRSRK
ncbi:hypothetical protein G9A89_015665 [Geosiphon pyriformis]|nr:hypothetical protein G9A89_015665 [Geosiphon pyriformis]